MWLSSHYYRRAVSILMKSKARGCLFCCTPPLLQSGTSIERYVRSRIDLVVRWRSCSVKDAYLQGSRAARQWLCCLWCSVQTLTKFFFPLHYFRAVYVSCCGISLHAPDVTSFAAVNTGRSREVLVTDLITSCNRHLPFRTPPLVDPSRRGERAGCWSECGGEPLAERQGSSVDWAVCSAGRCRSCWWMDSDGEGGSKCITATKAKLIMQLVCCCGHVEKLWWDLQMNVHEKIFSWFSSSSLNCFFLFWLLPSLAHRNYNLCDLSLLHFGKASKKKSKIPA